MKLILFTIVIFFNVFSMADSQLKNDKLAPFGITSSHHKIADTLSGEETVISGVGYEDIYKGTISRQDGGESVLKIILQKLALKSLRESNPWSDTKIIRAVHWVGVEVFINPKRFLRDFQDSWFKKVNIDFYTCEPNSDLKALGNTRIQDLDPKKWVKKFKDLQNTSSENCIIEFSPSRNCSMLIEKKFNNSFQADTYVFSLDPEICDSPYVSSPVSVEAVPSVFFS